MIFKKISYRTNLNAIANMTIRESNTIYHKGMINTDNANSSEILTITTKVCSSFFYSNKRNYYAIVRKVTSKIMA